MQSQSRPLNSLVSVVAARAKFDEVPDTRDFDIQPCNLAQEAYDRGRETSIALCIDCFDLERLDQAPRLGLCLFPSR